jgi:magnesium chelatase accessory protein
MSLDWNVDGPKWPHNTLSKFITAGKLNWHVQVTGDGPVLLLLHGTGASTHSWRDSIQRLAPHFTVIVPDLPGHGFTSLADKSDLTLRGMSRGLCDLMMALGLTPDYVVGHSAGAAIGLRMALDGQINPAAIVSLNGALLPFPGVASIAFPALAKVLFLNPFSDTMASRIAANPKNVARFIQRTGSELPPESLAFYETLFKDKRHVTATINMMARWDLHALKNDLRKLQTPLTLVSGGRDLAVPLWVSRHVEALVPSAKSIVLNNCGHLAHEEQPEMVCDLIVEQAKVSGILKNA